MDWFEATSWSSSLQFQLGVKISYGFAIIVSDVNVFSSWFVMKLNRTSLGKLSFGTNSFIYQFVHSWKTFSSTQLSGHTTIKSWERFGVHQIFRRWVTWTRNLDHSCNAHILHIYFKNDSKQKVSLKKVVILILHSLMKKNLEGFNQFLTMKKWQWKAKIDKF